MVDINEWRYGHVDRHIDIDTAEPRIAEQVWIALGDAQTVLNVGAGSGSYEPSDRDVTAVEPSAVMRAMCSLRVDLASGRWEERNRDLLHLDAAELDSRLLIA